MIVKEPEIVLGKESPPDDPAVNPPRVIVEFFGMARQKAEVGEIEINAAILGDALRKIESACPNLAHHLLRGAELSPEYRVSLNGERFIRDLEEYLPNGARVLLLSADSGG
jgi:hypothetical protein